MGLALTTSHGRLANDTAGTATTSASVSPRHSHTRACDRRRHRRGGAFTRVHARRLATRPRPHRRARCDSWDSHARRHVSRSQTRRARLPKQPKNKHAGGNCCYTARTVPVRASSSSTRSEARVVTRVLNQIRPSSRCLRTRIRTKNT